MGDVDVNAMIFTNVVAKRNRNVSVKNVIVKQNRNAIVFMKRKGINNKKEYDWSSPCQVDSNKKSIMPRPFPDILSG
ncbi:hypothetical protein MMK25_22880, partial [Bacillus cereus]|nr:hypothetical protein [Bacillus cereus]